MNTKPLPFQQRPAFLFILWLAIFIVWGLSGWLLIRTEDPGKFGDMFGAVNALFSGLAFGTLIYTTWLQREELALQRKELEATREVLKGHEVQLKDQNRTFQLQRFENTFFSLLRTYGELVESVDLVDDTGRITKGRDCFRIFYKRLRKKFLEHPQHEADSAALEVARTAYDAFYSEHQDELGHYFRHLYHIIKFVNSAPVDDKGTYTNFVRAQLSSSELALLFYNCLSDQGNEKFKPLVEKYAFLKNLPTPLLLRPALHTALYADAAYRKNAF